MMSVTDYMAPECETDYEQKIFKPKRSVEDHNPKWSTEGNEKGTVESGYYEMKSWHRFLFPTFFADSNSAIMK